MNTSTFRISIPKPCTENWDQMSAADKGRHCSSCNKVVVDLRGKTNEEILDLVKGREGKVCGRVTSSQLSPSVQPMLPQRGFFMQRFLAAVLISFGAFLFSLNAEAKGMIRDLKMEWVDSAGQKKADTVYVKGTVLNESTKKPIPYIGVSVFYQEKYIGMVTTDEKGRYKFPITNDSIRVVTVSTGTAEYEYKQVPNVSLKNKKVAIVNFKLKEDHREWMGDIEMEPQEPVNPPSPK